MLWGYTSLDCYTCIIAFRSSMVCWNPSLCLKETEFQYVEPTESQSECLSQAVWRFDEEIQSTTRLPHCWLLWRILLLGDRAFIAKVRSCPHDRLLELSQCRCPITVVAPFLGSLLLDTVEDVTILWSCSKLYGELITWSYHNDHLFWAILSGRRGRCLYGKSAYHMVHLCSCTHPFPNLCCQLWSLDVVRDPQSCRNQEPKDFPLYYLW